MVNYDAAPKSQKESLADADADVGVTKGGFMQRAIRCARQRDFQLQLALLAFMLFWYSFLLWLSPIDPKRDLTFNSMLSHLLHGRFDVDPAIIGDEGFLRNGRVYSYFGIWCALLRFPLWLAGRMNIDMTIWSCLTAVCLAAMAKVRTVLLLRRHGAQDKTAKHAVNMMLAYIVLGGSEVGYLRASIYQEVVFWAIAFASFFVYFGIKGLVAQHFDIGTLSGMALCAGLALLTRVSTAVGLYIAIELLILVLSWQATWKVTLEYCEDTWQRFWSFFRHRMLIPIGILTVFVLVTSVINHFRWGNALSFADFHLQLETRIYTDRLPRLTKYGTFNLKRIPFSMMYYFVPAWAIRTGSGNFLFEKTQERLFDAVELPPSTFFLTDLLPLCFVMFLVVALRKRRPGVFLPTRQLASIALGLSVPIFLLLEFTYLSYRYRMEFYPEIDFLAFLGLYMVLVDDKLRAMYERRRIWMEAALIVSVVASFACLFLYLFAPFGPAQDWVHRGVVFGGHFILF